LALKTNESVTVINISKNRFAITVNGKGQRLQKIMHFSGLMILSLTRFVYYIVFILHNTH